MLSNIMCRFSTFADYSNLQYSDQNIKRLSEFISQESFVLNRLMQVDSYNQNVPRIQLIKGNNLLAINFLSERIDIASLSNRLDGFNQNELDDICDKISSYMGKIDELFSDIIQAPNRLAWYTEYVYFDISDDEKKNFRNNFLKDKISIPMDISDEFGVKYAWKTNAEITNKKEDINILATIDRFKQLFNTSTDIDGYKIGFDINTFWENKKNRFSVDSNVQFINMARDFQKDLREDFLKECK